MLKCYLQTNLSYLKQLITKAVNLGPIGFGRFSCILLYFFMKFFLGGGLGGGGGLFNPLFHTSAFGRLKCKMFENIMKNGTFAPEEQMFHFP